MSNDHGCLCGYKTRQEYAKCQYPGCQYKWLLGEEPTADLASEKQDEIKSPDHYVSAKGLQPIELIMSKDSSGQFCKGNIIKYAFRAGSKLYPGMNSKESEIKDLEKIIQYAEFRIRQLKGEEIIPRNEQ